MAKLQLGNKLKALQTNWGGEIKFMPQFLSNLGVIHRITRLPSPKWVGRKKILAYS